MNLPTFKDLNLDHSNTVWFTGDALLGCVSGAARSQDVLPWDKYQSNKPCVSSARRSCCLLSVLGRGEDSLQIHMDGSTASVMAN